jgi:hypothetical protein
MRLCRIDGRRINQHVKLSQPACDLQTGEVTRYTTISCFRYRTSLAAQGQNYGEFV